jgi:hypothetical protein
MSSITDGNGAALTSAEKKQPVRVQWDPERGPKLGVKPYRSIQIGISRSISQKWAEEWIESIEDVTGRAVLLKSCVDEGVVGEEELVGRGAMPVEKVYDVPMELRRVLKMDER